MKTVDLQSFDAVFARVKARFEERGRDGLICKQGAYKACSVLKLQKLSWTNDPMEQLENRSGIFFSIWVNAVSIRQNRVNYNIHALKLRELKGYSITSRNFAADFRSGFASMHSVWPNVSVDHGPLTLMEGWLKVDTASLERDLLVLLDGFQNLSPLLDRLLQSRGRGVI